MTDNGIEKGKGVAKAKKPAEGGSSATPPSEKPSGTSTPAAAAETKAAVNPKDSAAKPEAGKAKSASPAKAAASKGASSTSKAASPSSASKAASKPAGAKASATPASSAKTEKPEPPEETATKADPVSSPKAEPAKTENTAEKPEPPKASEPKPVATPAPAPQAAQPTQKRSSFWPLVLGGVVAGAIGFGLSEANLLQERTDAAALEQRLDEQSAALDALQEGASQSPTAAEPVDLSGLESQLTDLQQGLADLGGRIEEQAERISTLKARPIGGGVNAGEANQAYEEALASLQAALSDQKSEIDAQRGEIEELIANARSVEEATADAARAATAQNALAQIGSALSSGAAFDEELTTLQEAGIAEVPQALAAVSESGTVTLANLQSRYPDLARQALTEARRSGAVEGEEGLGGFLRRQLGARSVMPRDGDDPDAILSRAEAALRDGQLATTIEELESLPASSQEVMAGWLADAKSLQEARTAVQDLSQSLTAN